MKSYFAVFLLLFTIPSFAQSAPTSSSSSFSIETVRQYALQLLQEAAVNTKSEIYDSITINRAIETLKTVNLIRGAGNDAARTSILWDGSIEGIYYDEHLFSSLPTDLDAGIIIHELRHTEPENVRLSKTNRDAAECDAENFSYSIIKNSHSSEGRIYLPYVDRNVCKDFDFTKDLCPQTSLQFRNKEVIAVHAILCDHEPAKPSSDLQTLAALGLISNTARQSEPPADSKIVNHSVDEMRILPNIIGTLTGRLADGSTCTLNISLDSNSSSTNPVYILKMKGLNIKAMARISATTQTASCEFCEMNIHFEKNTIGSFTIIRNGKQTVCKLNP